jgi:formylglycine-generating enzyme required for sulfatase activity
MTGTMAASGFSPAGLRVFISSTYLDNQHRRELVRDAIERADMVPVGMERFAASTDPAVDVCVRLAAECDLYVGIVAHRYGWAPEGHAGKSITWLEYEAAKKAGRPRLMFQIDPDLPLNPLVDMDPGPDRWDKQKKLDEFRAIVRADQMPALFGEDTLLGVVLHSLHDHLARLVPQSAPSPAPTAGPVPAALALYRDAMLEEHGSIALNGFKTRLRVPIALEDLYIPLHAMVDQRACGDAVFPDANAAGQVLRNYGSEEIPLAQAFACAQRLGRKGLVLLGDPGSGKTTHLKRLLLACWRESPATLGLPAAMVPVFLPVRRYVSGLALADFIDAEMNAELRGRLGAGFGARLLERGQLLLLFDGLDEVAEPGQRVAVVRWIEEACAAHPTCVPVVSCRFAGYGRQAGSGRARAEVRLSEKFLELHVRPLDAKQVETFVRNWYHLVEAGLDSDRVKAQARAQERADALAAELGKGDFRTARVAEMVSNPLLLANLCLVHRDGGALPRGRVRLYQECVEVLLERWREGRGQTVNVTAEQGRRVLQPAALWLHEEQGRTRASWAELAPALEPALQAVRWGGGTAVDFLRTVRDESGLLTGWGPDEFGFMHLGFQEYLAACELRRLLVEKTPEAEQALTRLAARYGESWWQEVLLLLVGVGNPSVFVPLMRAVVQKPAFAKADALLGLLLEEAAEVSPQPFVELVQIPPGKNAGDLWARQRVALEVLDRMGGKAQLAELEATLAQHPSPEIRARLAARAAAGQRVRVTAKGGVELVAIPGGKFLMGSPPEEEGRYDDEGPVHEVTLSPFWIGRYPVTNEEYGRYLKENPSAREPESWRDRRFNQARQPVVGVSWNEAAAFAAWAGCRLPTEAEWEYACRAGTTGPRYAGNLDAIAWHSGNSQGKLHAVGTKASNGWGLADMLGNVFEWCADWDGPYDGAAVTNPTGSEKGRERVRRGGSWILPARSCRSACRRGWQPDDRSHLLGFRLASGQ